MRKMREILFAMLLLVVIVLINSCGASTADKSENSGKNDGKIKQALTDVSDTTAEIKFRGYGFFPTSKSARVFWIGMESGPQLAQLAAAIDERMAKLGIQKEDRAFSPHLTLARATGGSGSPRWRKGDGPNRAFSYLQEKLSALPVPEFGTMTPREFFLYQSQLSPKGSKYTKLANFALG